MHSRRFKSDGQQHLIVSGTLNANVSGSKSLNSYLFFIRK